MKIFENFSSTTHTKKFKFYELLIVEINEAQIWKQSFSKRKKYHH
jgi:hypothetical protein